MGAGGVSCFLFYVAARLGRAAPPVGHRQGTRFQHASPGALSGPGSRARPAYIDGSNLVVQKKVSGANTTLGSAPFAATGGAAYSLRFRVVGTTLYPRVWPAGSAEPTTWLVTATDSALASGYSGLRITLQTGVTATLSTFQVAAE